ncbi:hypothetical protein GW17_00053813 [Ensete ventricosum]|nr:hypothetical protein GW17_00053813 [Ensete ventricosum]
MPNPWRNSRIRCRVAASAARFISIPEKPHSGKFLHRAPLLYDARALCNASLELPWGPKVSEESPTYPSRSNSQPQTMEVAVGMSKASNSMIGVHSSIGGSSATQSNILQSQVITDPLRVDMTGKIASSSSFPPCEAPKADENENVIPRPTVGASLAEKLLKALSLFKESAGGGILAQAWLPLKQGNEYVLSTSYQPYLLDQVLAGYREASRLFTFSVREAPGQNGISRWPSRKIKKVNHSVQKIQSVINSAPGILEKLRYDPTTGSLITEVSSPEKEISSQSAGQGVLPMYSIKRFENKQFEGTSEVEKCLIGDSQHMESSGQLRFLPGEQDKAHVASLHRYNEHKHTLVGGVSNLAEVRCHQDGSIKRDIHSESLECRMVSRCSFSKLAMEEMQTETGACDQNAKDNSSVEYRNPCSNRPVSSSGSSSSGQTAKKSVETDLMPIKTNKLPVNGGSAICVKATYKKDLVRFKFYPFMCCNQLFEEIGKRFNLSIGTFQLKYKDDEEEWVMLVTDSDLQECIEMLESLESQSVRLLVQDIPSAVGSSGSSNSLFLKS